MDNNDAIVNNNVIYGRQGWICPLCGAALSPDTTFCPSHLLLHHIQ